MNHSEGAQMQANCAEGDSGEQLAV